MALFVLIPPFPLSFDIHVEMLSKIKNILNNKFLGNTFLNDNVKSKKVPSLRLMFT